MMRLQQRSMALAPLWTLGDRMPGDARCGLSSEPAAHPVIPCPALLSSCCSLPVLISPFRQFVCWPEPFISATRAACAWLPDVVCMGRWLHPTRYGSFFSCSGCSACTTGARVELMHVYPQTRPRELLRHDVGRVVTNVCRAGGRPTWAAPRPAGAHPIALGRLGAPVLGSVRGECDWGRHCFVRGSAGGCIAHPWWLRGPRTNSSAMVSRAAAVPWRSNLAQAASAKCS